MNDVETSYECVFMFDSFARTVSAYTLKNLVKNTDIILSYNNLIQNIDINEKSDEIVTALSVYGGNNLGISAVNPLGTNTIYDFSYFATTEWMDQDLINAIKTWEAAIAAQQTRYSNLLTQYKDKNTEIVTANSTLVDLKTDRDAIEGVVKVMIEGDLKNTPEYTAKVNELNAANAAVTAQENHINDLKTQLEVINSDLIRCLREIYN